MPLFSVAIPTYRRLTALRRAIDSVFAQTCTDWEMVISDDESPSGETWKFLNSLARSDTRVRPIKNGNPHGAPFNHNAALRASQGEWIKILHDDDVLKPNCLEVLADIVRSATRVWSRYLAHAISLWTGGWSARFADAIARCLNRSIRKMPSWLCTSWTRHVGRYQLSSSCTVQWSTLAFFSKGRPV